ncbi:hypothetical protein GE300_11275 [Rhodobacteraceae bacterium 2CG4]|uniref:WD40 repeat protein n=1 Tax=Halovulum marinum TaxID=2662447 RepID=A0A6L5Z2E2_9RHOB|nr:TolB family protein [Halovulum marinum]MSU90192.1 hypothetical protein [Halovulum marinum]
MRSHIHIFDLAADSARTLFTAEAHVEAPNWHPGGDRLLVNADGRIWTLPLDAPALQPVDTGFATACNNDHGPSPDGRTLAISDKTETGKSCIYTLPLAGGAPARLTPDVPSYFHGWAPDGRTIAYCALRDGAFDIFTMPAAGGGETRLTRDLGHCDGPDYTPDGAWIWFNADKPGHAQLYRVPAAGGAPERMTRDARVNWFPHPSPDGRQVLYLSYPPGTEGHPGGLEVELRLMPATGGEPRTLLQLFGGQGTINVPCWAPDSRHFAFASYERDA